VTTVVLPVREARFVVAEEVAVEDRLVEQAGALVEPRLRAVEAAVELVIVDPEARAAVAGAGGT
jgi:hypothetical protein